MKKSNVITYILVLICTTNCFSQDDLAKKIDLLFLNTSANGNPIAIEKQKEISFEVSDSIVEEKNKITFSNHPLISNFTNGTLNAYYFRNNKELFDDYGLYTIQCVVNFSDSKKGLKEYNKLIEEFKLFGSIIKTTTFKDRYDLRKIQYYTTLFLKDNETEFPRLEISYHDYYESDEGFQIIILYHHSWNNKETYHIKFFND